MPRLLDLLRTRILPAILTAAGVALVVAGLLSYTAPVEAIPTESPAATDGLVTASPFVTPTFGASGSPGASPSAAADRVATRVQIPALGIDLPVIRPPGGPSAYPLCNVAMYIQVLGQPGQGRGIYMYAHARKGMFLPILDASKVNNGAKMKGMIVNVYTSDDRLYLYEIFDVRRHQLDLNDAIDATTEELWLQTSEGPRGTPGKTQVVARLLSTQAADHAAAHPKANPVVCG
jgi:hypothetical protein